MAVLGDFTNSKQYIKKRRRAETVSESRMSQKGSVCHKLGTQHVLFGFSGLRWAEATPGILMSLLPINYQLTTN